MALLEEIILTKKKKGKRCASTFIYQYNDSKFTQSRYRVGRKFYLQNFISSKYIFHWSFYRCLSDAIIPIYYVVYIPYYILFSTTIIIASGQIFSVQSSIVERRVLSPWDSIVLRQLSRSLCLVKQKRKLQHTSVIVLVLDGFHVVRWVRVYRIDEGYRCYRQAL